MCPAVSSFCHHAFSIMVEGTLELRATTNPSFLTCFLSDLCLSYRTGNQTGTWTQIFSHSENTFSYEVLEVNFPPHQSLLIFLCFSCCLSTEGLRPKGHLPRMEPGSEPVCKLVLKNTCLSMNCIRMDVWEKLLKLMQFIDSFNCTSSKRNKAIQSIPILHPPHPWNDNTLTLYLAYK